MKLATTCLPSYPVKSLILINTEYSMVWRWQTEFISYVTRNFYIYLSAKHEWKYEKCCLTSKINSIFNVKSIEFSV